MKWVLCFMLAIGSAFLYGQGDWSSGCAAGLHIRRKGNILAEALAEVPGTDEPEVERELLWSDFLAAQSCLARLQNFEID